MLRRRHDEKRLQLLVQLVVERRHLELVLEVGDGAQSLHHGLGAHAAGEVDEQLVERLDAHVGQIARDLLHKGHSLLEGEERLFLRRDSHGNDDLVDKLGGTADNVEMSGGDGVEGAGGKRTFHGGSLSLNGGRARRLERLGSDARGHRTVAAPTHGRARCSLEVYTMRSAPSPRIRKRAGAPLESHCRKDRCGII